MTLLPLTQDITYWTVATRDGRNNTTYNVGIKIKGRWVRRDGIVRDVKGKDRKASFIVYSTILIPRGAFVALGDFEGQALTADKETREVIDHIENTSLSDLIKHVA